MPGEKFLKHNGSGAFTEIESVQDGGSGGANKVASLDANGRWASTMMPTGIGADTAMIEASEALSAGDFINIYADGSDFKCRKSDASTAGKEAYGFVKGAVTSGNNATVYLSGINDQVSGATAGKAYLGTTAGGFSSTAPSASGNVVQVLGVAVSATSISFEPTIGIKLA